LIEPIEFNVFGVRVKEETVLKIRLAMNETYNNLAKKDKNWENSEFCKREIASLWDAIVDMLSRFSEELFHEIGPYEIRTLLVVDKDNRDFVETFGYELKSNDALSDILKELREISIVPGSLRIFFRDSVSQKMVEARIEMNKIIKQIWKERDKIKTGLKYFVDWVKNNRRTLITCSMVSGLLVISLVAICYIGVPIQVVNLLIMCLLGLICLIYDAYSTSETLQEAMKKLSRRSGITLRM
jgi:hypothetical protein